MKELREQFHKRRMKTSQASERWVTLILCNYCQKQFVARNGQGTDSSRSGNFTLSQGKDTIYCHFSEWNRSKILFNEIELQADAGLPRKSIL